MENPLVVGVEGADMDVDAADALPLREDGFCDCGDGSRVVPKVRLRNPPVFLMAFEKVWMWCETQYSQYSSA